MKRYCCYSKGHLYYTDTAASTRPPVTGQRHCSRHEVLNFQFPFQTKMDEQMCFCDLRPGCVNHNTLTCRLHETKNGRIIIMRVLARQKGELAHQVRFTRFVSGSDTAGGGDLGHTGDRWLEHRSV